MSIHQMRMADAMAVGAARYTAALAELNRVGKARFTQTGGMCAALEVVLERGYLLVTDLDDDLPWEPERVRGWGVGFYWTDDVCEGPVVFVSDEDPRLEALSGLIKQCMCAVAATHSGH